MRNIACLCVLLALVFLSVSSVQASTDLEAAHSTFEQGDFLRAAEDARALGTAEGQAFAARATLVHADLVAELGDRLPFVSRAEEDARAAIAAAPDFAEGHLQLAVALGFKARLEGRFTAHAEGYADEAKAHLDHVAAREPDNPWLHALLGGWHLEIAEAGGFIGRSIYGAGVAAGVESYDKALALRPSDLVIVYQCALQLAALGEDPLKVRAMSLLQNTPLPDEPDALERLMLERMQKLKEALASNNATIIDRVVSAQKGETVPTTQPRRHQIRPPIGSPR